MQLAIMLRMPDLFANIAKHLLIWLQAVICQSILGLQTCPTTLCQETQHWLFQIFIAVNESRILWECYVGFVKCLLCEKSLKCYSSVTIEDLLSSFILRFLSQLSSDLALLSIRPHMSPLLWFCCMMHWLCMQMKWSEIDTKLWCPLVTPSNRQWISTEHYKSML